LRERSIAAKHAEQNTKNHQPFTDKPMIYQFKMLCQKGTILAQFAYRLIERKAVDFACFSAQFFHFKLTGDDYEGKPKRFLFVYR